MLSETLANLTRRIAKEFDHLSEERKSGDVTSSEAQTDPTLSTPSSLTAPKGVEATTPALSKKTADASTSKAASTRRPAKKTRGRGDSNDAGQESTNEQDESGSAVSGDWRRIHVN